MQRTAQKMYLFFGGEKRLIAPTACLTIIGVSLLLENTLTPKKYTTRAASLCRFKRGAAQAGCGDLRC